MKNLLFIILVWTAISCTHKTYTANFRCSTAGVSILYFDTTKPAAYFITDTTVDTHYHKDYDFIKYISVSKKDSTYKIANDTVVVRKIAKYCVEIGQ